MAVSQVLPKANTTVLVVDDNELYRLEIEMILSEIGYVIWLSTDDPEEALRAIKTRNHLPNIMLLDIRLKGEMDGISFAKLLAGQQIPTIYMTSYPEDKQFQRALTTHPSAYLLKPIRDLELHHAIQLACSSNEGNQTQEQFQSESTQQLHKKMTLKDSDNTLRQVAISEIYAIESYGNLLFFHTKLGRFILRKTMKEIEQELANHGFMRIHRRFIIALTYWERKKPLGKELVVAKKHYPLGRSYRKKIQELLTLG